MVNTACGAADVPEDSELPPTINCDPAGLEMDGDPTHEKTLISAKPVGNGQWEVVYGLEVKNTTATSASYTLDDELHFTEEATIVSAEVTSSPDGVTLAEPAWDGQGNLTIASGVPLAGNEDDGYVPHEYVLTVLADVPLQVPGAGSADDPTTCGSDGDDADTAFNNTSAMTDSAGAVENDQACAPIPSIDITKSVVGDPVAGKDGTWTITYAITAVNTGDAEGTYTLTDRLRFGSGIDVTSAEVTATPKGVTAAGSWTGQGIEGADANVITADVTLPAGGKHTYRVQVQATVTAMPLTGPRSRAPSPGWQAGRVREQGRHRPQRPGRHRRRLRDTGRARDAERARKAGGAERAR